MKNQMFSERTGLETKKAFQKDDLDKESRISIWNIFYRTINNFIKDQDQVWYVQNYLWIRYFNLPCDELENNLFYDYSKDYIFKKEWNKVFDLIEATLGYLLENHDEIYNTFIEAINIELKKHNVLYQVIENKITPVSDKNEVIEIESALGNSNDRFSLVNTHLITALKHLSDRENPDYRNSMKESISAIESMCKIISGDPNADLGKALAKIEKEGELKLHKALKTGFTRLYDYTSDIGVRHGMKNDPNLDVEDARYMLVTCSAFINYLIVKADKANIFNEQD